MPQRIDNQLVNRHPITEQLLGHHVAAHSLQQQQQQHQQQCINTYAQPNQDIEMDISSKFSSSTLNCQNSNYSYGSACSYGSLSSPLDEQNDLNAKDDDMTFCMSNYAKEALKMMFMMRSHNMLTDVVLEVKQELFPAHKVVLSAASPYFKAMFTGGLKEAEMSRVQLQGVCPTAMGRIIYFMYTGHIRVTEVTVCQLLPAATMFQVPNVINACCAFLERQLDPTNAIGIANFAEQHCCEELQKKANHFIERHFTQVCQEEEFLQLSAYQLIALIRRDELNVQEEREVYNAVLKWVKYDEDNRYPRMEHILYAVRCQFLTPNFLKEQMKNCDVLRKVPACREYLAKIFKDLTLHKLPVVKERTPNTTRMIFVAGGFFRQSLDILEAYNVDDKTWTALPNLRIPRSGLGAAFLKGTFYAVGGRNNSIGSSYDSDWVDRYNAVTEQWRPCAPMSVPRHRVGVAVMDELMYAVGGSAGSEYHCTVEYYDPEWDRWTLVQPMHEKRLGVGVVVVNRLLYAVGGFTGTDRLATVECYHPENNEWNFVPPMKCGRSGAGVAAINQYIYVVGGFDGTRQLCSVERFDTENQVWEHVAPVKIARSALSLTSLDGKLYAIGGFDGSNFLSIVEVYDPETDQWEQGTPLNSGRSGHASAVIYQPSCASNFMDCIESDNSKPDGGSSEDKKDDTSAAGPSSSKSDSSAAGAYSYMQFHTSFGSSGCRNCENELRSPGDEPENCTWQTEPIPISSLRNFRENKRTNELWPPAECEDYKPDISELSVEQPNPNPMEPIPLATIREFQASCCKEDDQQQSSSNDAHNNLEAIETKPFAWLNENELQPHADFATCSSRLQDIKNIEPITLETLQNFQKRYRCYESKLASDSVENLLEARLRNETHLMETAQLPASLLNKNDVESIPLSKLRIFQSQNCDNQNSLPPLACAESSENCNVMNSLPAVSRNQNFHCANDQVNHQIVNYAEPKILPSCNSIMEPIPLSAIKKFQGRKRRCRAYLEENKIFLDDFKVSSSMQLEALSTVDRKKPYNVAAFSIKPPGSASACSATTTNTEKLCKTLKCKRSSCNCKFLESIKTSAAGNMMHQFVSSFIDRRGSKNRDAAT